MVASRIKATVDRLSDAERRDLLHYLEQTVEDDFELTEEQVVEVERRDSEVRSGAVAPLTIDQVMQRVRARLK